MLQILILNFEKEKPALNYLGDYYYSCFIDVWLISQ